MSAGPIPRVPEPAPEEVDAPARVPSTGRVFWAELATPAGRWVIETRSLRELVSHIRFVAATEGARVVSRGPVPAGASCCPTCQDLYLGDEGGAPVCPDCSVNGDDEA